MSFIRTLCQFALILLSFLALSMPSRGQDGPAETPLTSQELVKLVYQLPSHPELKDEVVAEIRKRGIGFPLTEGMRTLVAAKSGSDPVIRRTLEEAERRRANPTAESRPLPADASDLLERTRAATLAAADAMPDFIVRQQVTRYHALGSTHNWMQDDRLVIGVAYRQSVGEQYRLLAVNGVPQESSQREGSSYGEVDGATSTGEYVSRLASLFSPNSRTQFKVIDTDSLQGRPTLVYEYEVAKDNSIASLKFKATKVAAWQETIVGSRGRIWIDREKNRVLRLEDIATEIEPGFPITASSNVIDYSWVKINDQDYLLPSRAIVEMSAGIGQQVEQTRNDIRFRGYQKFGAELKIIDDDDEAPAEKPEKTQKPTKPEKP